MSLPLPDVNVLVALMWPHHASHGAARAWFGRVASQGWATTPITEAGLVRLSCNRSVVSAPTDPAGALEALDALTRVGRHRFVPDDVPGVLLPDLVTSVRGHRQITDAHLVSLCQRHGLRLVTFDQGIGALGADDALVEVLDD